MQDCTKTAGSQDRLKPLGDLAPRRAGALRGRLSPRLLLIGCAVPLSAIASGCAGNGELSTAALPGLPKIALPQGPPPVVGTPTEVYARIGRGAMACWFGANGFLKSTHIYDATAEPVHKGGQAEIIIRERDERGQNLRGLKAFRIVITPSDNEQTNVVAENLKLPEATAARMKKSVAAWSTGNNGCDPDAFEGAWAASETGEAEDREKTTRRNARVVKRKP